MIEAFVASVFAVAYCVRVLLFDGSIQPFQNLKNYVLDGANDGAGTYPVGLFDHVRRLFGAYKIEDANGIEVWKTTVRMDLWRCPKCLSFWVSFVASAPFTFLFTEWYAFPVVHLSIVYCVQFLIFVQLWFEEE